MRNKNKKNLYKSIILLVIVIIGIGYAYLTSNLSITGSTEVVANTWDIHFENLNVTTGSVTASTPATIDSNETSITYAITLSRPKEYYEFTVDVVNEGTLPGKVSVSTLSGLDTNSSKVIDYSIKYTNGNPVNTGDILNGGATKTIKVRVYYKDDITEDDFPDNNLNLNLTYTLQYVQSEEDALRINDEIINLSTSNACISKYNGNVTDQVGDTKSAEKVYFDNCIDKRNIIFNDMCWQVIRTTETNGTKIIYNGEAVDGKCETSRGNHRGLNANYIYQSTLSSNYLYGSSFTYSKGSNQFTINDTFNETWSDSTYTNLLSKYTCMSNSNKCTTLYYVNSYKSNTEAYTVRFTTGNTYYFATGVSPFNAYYDSIDMVGYMFNDRHEYIYVTMDNTEYKYGSSFTYDENTSKYILTGTTQNISNWSSDYIDAYDTRYTCWNTSGECSELSYLASVDSNRVGYFNMTNGIGYEETLNNMVANDDVNKYDSAIKAYLDGWYANNMTLYSSYLENNVYCNNRSISDIDTTHSGIYVIFKPNELTNNLSCSNITDQFAIGNNKANLDYSIGLITAEELKNFTNVSIMSTDNMNILNAPSRFDSYTSYVIGFNNSINGVENNVLYSYYVRPVVSLKKSVTVSKGIGSEADPWVID